MIKDQGWTILPLSPSNHLTSPTSLKRKVSWQSEVLWSLADFLWSLVVVAPLVVIYWRGTWDLLEDSVSNYPNRGEFDIIFIR